MAAERTYLSFADVSPSVVGPTMIIPFDMPTTVNVEAALKGRVKGERGYRLEPNSAPFKEVALSDPPVVKEKWDGTRFPQRHAHVTILPFNEFKSVTEEQKEQLKAMKFTIDISENEVFWVRGSPGNASAGCKGVFYANAVLSPATEQAIIKARQDVGLPDRPPPAAHFVNENDKDDRLAEFRYHKAITSVVPDFVDEVDKFSELNQAEAQEAILQMSGRIAVWAADFSIVRDAEGEGNILVHTASTPKGASATAD
jgi:hypothetical protein